MPKSSKKFGPDNDDERREIWRWLLFDNHKLTANVATYRFLLRFAKTGETPVTDFVKGRLKSALKVLDGHLGDSDFVVANRPTIADISLAGYLFWPDEFDVTWDDFSVDRLLAEAHRGVAGLGPSLRADARSPVAGEGLAPSVVAFKRRGAGGTPSPRLRSYP